MIVESNEQGRSSGVDIVKLSLAVKFMVVPVRERWQCQILLVGACMHVARERAGWCRMVSNWCGDSLDVWCWQATGKVRYVILNGRWQFIPQKLSPVSFLPVESYRSRRVWLWSLPIMWTFGEPNDNDPEGGAGYLTRKANITS
jgi:hypothetical protein